MLVRGAERQSMPSSRVAFSHGFSTGSCVFIKSLTLRETMVRLWCSAVAASKPSIADKALPHSSRWRPIFPIGRRRLYRSAESCRRNEMQLHLQPCLQAHPASALRKPCQALTNLSEREHAQVQQAFLSRFQPSSHARFRGVRQPRNNRYRKTAHSSTSRPSSLFRSKSSSTPTRGDSRKNCRRFFG